MNKLIGFDSRLVDPVAAKAANGFLLAFDAGLYGLAACAACGSANAELDFKFGPGDLSVVTRCRGCGAHSERERFIAASWRDALSFGFDRWQFAQAENPVCVEAGYFDVAAVFEAAYGDLSSFLLARIGPLGSGTDTVT